MILRLLELLLLCVCTGALTWFVQLTFEKGMIFRKYYAFIFYWLHYKTRRVVKKDFVRHEPIWGAMCQTENGILREIVGYKSIYKTTLLFKPKWYNFFFYPLGGCPYCNGTWVFIIVFLTLYLPFSLTDIILLALGCGVNYLSILLISKIK